MCVLNDKMCKSNRNMWHKVYYSCIILNLI